MGLKRDSIVSLVGTVCTGVVVLLSVPLLLQKIGDVRFGTLTLVWLIAGYAGLLDFGLSRATARYIAIAESLAQHAQIIWSAVWLCSAIGLVFGVIVYLCGGGLLHGLASTKTESDLMPIVPWIATLIPLALINGVLIGALEGRQRFVAVNIGQVLTTALMQAFPTVAAYWIGPELSSIVPAAVFARMISTALLFVVALYAVVPARPRCIDWHVTRRLFASGTWFSLAGILGTLFQTIDKFFIAWFVGPSAVAHYSVPESVVRRTSLLPLAMIRPLFPRLTSLEEKASRLLAQRSLELVILLMTPIVVVAILGVRVFLNVWVGKEFSSVSAPIGALIAFGLWFNSLAFVPDIYLQARGKASISVLCSSIELVPHLLLLYVGLTRFGLWGGACALLLITVLDVILLTEFAGLRIWRLRVFWIGCGFVSVAYVSSMATAPSTLGVAISFIEVVAVTTWSCLVSKDLQSIVRPVLARAGSILGRVVT
jgi:O-antigen/teichoic acid export membrane protein